jgi:glycosyltransferase involved in cell wall biosynthesis
VSDEVPGLCAAGADDFLIVSMGGLVKNKGHHVLIEAARLLSRQLPAIKLVICGEGPEYSALQKAIDRHRLSSKIVLVGFVRQVRKMLRDADLFVLPSIHREGLSLAVLEAMEQGLPVVASRIGGIPEVVEDGVTGLHVPPNDAPALASAIKRLVDDPGLRRRMGAEGQKKIRGQFSAEKMIAQIESLYESV